MSDWLRYVEMGGRLLPLVIGWIRDLVDAGSSDPEGEVRATIADRREEIVSRRAANDARLRAKHRGE